MKRLTALAAVGFATAAVTSGIAFAAPAPHPGGRELRLGEAYAGVGQAQANGSRGTARAARAQAPAGLKGVDVSNWQTTNVDWAGLYQRNGVRFAFIKATESANTAAKPAGGYVNPIFVPQYSGARNAGLVRGAYHFAQPHESTGGVQADFFINHGGGWRPGGWTLPGVLDIENNPYKPINHLNDCYNKTRPQMVQWIRAFSDRYRRRTGRLPVIYTNRAWWESCTGNNTGFGTHPLWITGYGATPGRTPAGWRTYNFWQYAEAPASNPAGNPNWNVFNGSLASLQKLAAQARTSLAKVDAKPEPVRRGRPLTVTGTLSWHNGAAWKPLAAKRVSIQFLPRGASRWVTKGPAVTDRFGGFRKSFTAQRAGTWRAVFGATPIFLGATSTGDYVKLR